MRRLAAIFLSVTSVLALGVSPAVALSCAEPEPIDWSVRLPAAEAAAIGVIEKIELIDGYYFDAGISLRVRVTERLHGHAPEILEYTTPNFNPWGPYYALAEEIAIVIEDGEISDGQQNICGPWFSPEELRAAAAEFGQVDDVRPTLLDRILSLIEDLLRLLFG